MNETGYVAQKRRHTKWPSSKCNKRRRVDYLAQLQSAKRTKLREGTTISVYGDTCHNAESHFAADGFRLGHSSKVRNIALQNIAATTIYLCPFAISEGVLCRWSGIPFEIGRHVRGSHYSERVKGTGESEWIWLSLPLEQTYQRAIFTLDKLFSKLCSRNTHVYSCISQFFTSDIRTILVATHIILKMKTVNSKECILKSVAM